MKLFLVERADECDDYEYDAHVVRAPDEATAKAIAASHGGWTSENFVRVEEISADGEAGTILSSFNASY